MFAFGGYGLVVLCFLVLGVVLLWVFVMFVCWFVSVLAALRLLCWFMVLVWLLGGFGLIDV